MGATPLVGLIVVNGCLFVLYSSVVLKFSDLIFKKERGWLARLAVSMLNLCIGLAIMVSGYASPTLYYLAVYLVLYLEFIFFYRERCNRLALITAMYGVHIMSVRTIVLSILAWCDCGFLSGIASQSGFSPLTMTITLLLLIVATILVMQKMPTKKIRLVLRRDEQTFFLTIWLIICTCYLLLNSQVYRYDPSLSMVYQNQILSCLLLLTSIYLMIFYSFTNCTLLDVKQENQTLRAKMENQENFMDALTGHAKYSYEVNLTKNQVTKGFAEYEEVLNRLTRDYTRVLPMLSKMLVHPDDLAHVNALASAEQLLKEYEQGKLRQSFECRLRDATGQYYWAEFIINLITDSKTGDIMAFAYFIDIDNDKRTVLTLKAQAERDSLTGLYNKRTTEALISELLPSGAGVMFIIDVDSFKSVNDFLGHAKGDEVLCQLAKELHGIFRTGDIIGRIGGDEFMVYLPTAFQKDQALQKAEELLRRFFKSYVDASGKSHVISASIGIAAVTSKSMRFLELYKQADTALYCAKNQGKNTFHFYSSDELSESILFQ